MAKRVVAPESIPLADRQAMAIMTAVAKAALVPFACDVGTIIVIAGLEFPVIAPLTKAEFIASIPFNDLPLVELFPYYYRVFVSPSTMLMAGLLAKNITKSEPITDLEAVRLLAYVTRTGALPQSKIRQVGDVLSVHPAIIVRVTAAISLEEFIRRCNACGIATPGGAFEVLGSLALHYYAVDIAKSSESEQ